MTYLLQAKSMHRAISNIDEVMKKTMIDYEIIGLSKTNVYDVFEHKTKEEKEQKSNEEKRRSKTWQDLKKCRRTAFRTERR